MSGVIRKLRINNVYGEEEIVTFEQVALSDYTEFSNEEWGDYLRETLFPLTGTGRSGWSDNAGYFIESIDGLEPAIDIEWC